MTNKQLSAHPGGLAVAFWGQQHRRATAVSGELPRKAPLKINLHSHSSSGLTSLPFALQEQKESCHPCSGRQQSHLGSTQCDRGHPVAKA